MAGRFPGRAISRRKIVRSIIMNTMHKTAILFLAILSFAGTPPNEGSREDGSSDHESEEKIVALSYACRFDEAAALLPTLDPGSSPSMRRGFFRAMIAWREYLFRGGAMIRDTILEDSFRTTMSAVVGSGEAVLSKAPDSAAALFYTGAGLGYLAELDAASGNYLRAAGEGAKALSYHKKLLSISSEWTDAYLTEGLFNLYASSAPWYLEPVLFILGKTGSKKLAHRYLGLVAEKGRLARYEAEESLALLYGMEQKYELAVSLYHGLAQRFPGAYFYYLRKSISMLSDGGEYDKAIAECRAVIDTAAVMRLTPLDSLYLGLVYVDLAADLGRLGRLKEAVRAYREMVGERIAPRFHSWAHLSLGRLYEKTGDQRRAIREYRWVVSRNEVPQHVKSARERLKELENKR